ncbi:MAG: hypothetical protein U0228_06930 [Myxococcaceae bacterium]
MDELHWAPRWPTLQPEYVVVEGEAARALARRLAGSPRLAQLRGVVAGNVLALTGDELPWVDGAQYFGREPDAPWLLVPTAQQAMRGALSVPASWLEHAWRSSQPGVDWPCVVRDVGGVPVLLPVGRAGPIDPIRLEAWARNSLAPRGSPPHPNPLLLGSSSGGEGVAHE